MIVDETRKQQMLEMLTHLYNSIEEGKGDITTFEYTQDRMDVTTFGSNYMNYVPSGPIRVSIEAEVYR